MTSRAPCYASPPTALCQVHRIVSPAARGRSITSSPAGAAPARPVRSRGAIRRCRDSARCPATRRPRIRCARVAVDDRTREAARELCTLAREVDCCFSGLAHFSAGAVTDGQFLWVQPPLCRIRRANTGHNLHGDLRRCDVPTTAFRSSTNPCQVHALVVPLVSRPHCVAVRPAFRRPDRTPDSRDIVDQRDHVGRGTAPGSAGEAGELRRPEEKALGLPSARPRPHAVAYPACHARPRNGGPRRCTTRERPRAYNARRSGAGPGRRSHSIAPCATSRRVPARDGLHCAAPACRHNTSDKLRDFSMLRARQLHRFVGRRPTPAPIAVHSRASDEIPCPGQRIHSEVRVASQPS